jgi:hypothetical protein
METVNQAINKVNPLTQEQRDEAYNATRKRIAGPEPVFSTTGVDDKYPRWITRTVTVLCLIMLVVAFLPSAMRLNAVALTTNLEIMEHETSVYVAALATVVMAEIGQIIFSLAAATNADKWQRRMLVFGAIVCTLIALSGNAGSMGIKALESVFAFLETFAPPVLVLIIAQILKSQMLHATEATHTSKRNHAHALMTWNAAYANANNAAAWDDTLANALRDALRSANRQSKAVLRELTNADWRALVIRERSAEEWWKVAAVEADQRNAELERLRNEEDLRIAMQERIQHRALEVGSYSTGATGEVASAKLTRKGDMYVKECPECKKKFEGDTQRKATNKLVAHMRVHAREQRAFALTNVPALEDDTEPVEAIAS